MPESPLYKPATILIKPRSCLHRSRRLQTRLPRGWLKRDKVSLSCDEDNQDWIRFKQGSVSLRKAAIAFDKAGLLLASLRQLYIKMRHLYIRFSAFHANVLDSIE